MGVDVGVGGIGVDVGVGGIGVLVGVGVGQVPCALIGKFGPSNTQYFDPLENQPVCETGDPELFEYI
jgi:hypothetical protein